MTDSTPDPRCLTAGDFLAMTANEQDDLVDRWHDDPDTPLALYEHLGLTWRQYADWVRYRKPKKGDAMTEDELKAAQVDSLLHERRRKLDAVAFMGRTGHDKLPDTVRVVAEFRAEADDLLRQALDIDPDKTYPAWKEADV